MKKILRSIFWSPEIYVLGLSVFLSYIFFDIYTVINDLVFPKYSTEIPYIPIVALFAIIITPTFFIAHKIIFPDEEYKKYMEWDGYKKVVFICKYSVAYQLIGVISFIVLFANRNEIVDYYRYTWSIYLSMLIALYTLSNAYINLKIILRKNQS